MSDPFFASTRKRKRPAKLTSRVPRDNAPAPPGRRGGRRQEEEEEQVVDDDADMGAEDIDDMDLEHRRGDDDMEESEDDEDETAAEKRLRLAQRYLEQIQDEVDEGGFNAEDVDRDYLAERLQEDVAESKGRVYRHVSSAYDFSTPTQVGHARNPMSTITSVAMKLPYMYTSAKDGSVAKWDLSSPTEPKRVRTVRKGRKGDETFEGHTQEVLSVAVSGDGRWVASAGSDKCIVVRSTDDLSFAKIFRHHRDTVYSLAFRRGTNTMYSASADRTVKHWDLSGMTYVETLFGHQDGIVDIAALAQERCISVGARDRTARVWKIVEETQLVLRGDGPGEGKKRKQREGPNGEVLDYSHPEGSMDTVAQVDEEHFLTGSDNGSISLWTLQKKKAQFTWPTAHGLDEQLKPEEHSAEVEPPVEAPAPKQPRWITALASLPYSDVFVSGSWDGFVRVWRVTPGMKAIEPIAALPVGPGVVNSLEIDESGPRGSETITIIAGVGQEHRLGRWKKVKKAKNGVVVFTIKKGSATSVDEEK
ncbi:pre-rRNA processing protein [Saitoella coloradoensis]